MIDFNPGDSNHEFVKIIDDGVPSTCCAKEGTPRANYSNILSQPPSIGCSISSIISNEVFLSDSYYVTCSLGNLDCIITPYSWHTANDGKEIWWWWDGVGGVWNEERRRGERRRGRAALRCCVEIGCR